VYYTDIFGDYSTTPHRVYKLLLFYGTYFLTNNVLLFTWCSYWTRSRVVAEKAERCDQTYRIL